MARFTTARVEKLLLDPGIIRNRAKVESTVRNAKAFLAVQKEFGTFDAYVWGFVGGRPVVNKWRRTAQLPPTSPESEALSKDLRRRGFGFVGPTVCYAHLQAAGSHQRPPGELLPLRRAHGRCRPIRTRAPKRPMTGSSGRQTPSGVPVVHRAELDEALRGVEGPVPGDVTVGGQRQLVVALGGRPLDGGAEEGPAHAVTAVIRMDGQLLQVGAAGEGIDAGQTLRWLPGHQDHQGAGEVGQGARSGQGPDPQRLEHRVGRRLEGRQERQLVGSGDPDVDHGPTVA